MRWSRLRKLSAANAFVWAPILLITWWISSVASYSDYQGTGVDWVVFVETCLAATTTLVLGVWTLLVRLGRVGELEDLYTRSSFLPNTLMWINAFELMGFGALLAAVNTPGVARLGVVPVVIAITLAVVSLAFGASMLVLNRVAVRPGAGVQR